MGTAQNLHVPGLIHISRLIHILRHDKCPDNLCNGVFLPGGEPHLERVERMPEFVYQ
jgi:hypothetical protein